MREFFYRKILSLCICASEWTVLMTCFYKSLEPSLFLCIGLRNWQRPPPLTEPEENALVCEPTVRMMGTVVRFMHRRIQQCSVFLRTRQWQAPSVWLGIIASGSDSENSREHAIT